MIKKNSEWISYIKYFAIEDLRKQHSRSSLGYFWIVLSQFVNIGGIAFVYAILFSQDIKSFFPYVSSGVVAWNYCSGTLNESTRGFSSNGSIIQNFKFPAWIFITQIVVKNFVILLYASSVHFIIYMILNHEIPLVALLIFPAFLIVSILLALFGMLLAYAGARFRDFPPAFGNIVYLMFLVTPIIWDSKIIPEKYSYLIDYNPFVYMIGLMRDPMIGHVPSLNVFAVVIMFILIGIAGNVIAYKKYASKLVYWV